MLKILCKTGATPNCFTVPWIRWQNALTRKTKLTRTRMTLTQVEQQLLQVGSRSLGRWQLSRWHRLSALLRNACIVLWRTSQLDEEQGDTNPIWKGLAQKVESLGILMECMQESLDTDNSGSVIFILFFLSYDMGPMEDASEVRCSRSRVILVSVSSSLWCTKWLWLLRPPATESHLP